MHSSPYEAIFPELCEDSGGQPWLVNALGRGRTDLLIEWPLDENRDMRGPLQRVVIEIKLRRRDSIETVIACGLEQTADYASRIGADEAHLVVFDRDPARTWDERIWRREEHFGDLPITVWGA